jgi:hypothetical protein
MAWKQMVGGRDSFLDSDKELLIIPENNGCICA